jgi:hypothetical protein
VFKESSFFKYYTLVKKYKKTDILASVGHASQIRNKAMIGHLHNNPCPLVLHYVGRENTNIAMLQLRCLPLQMQNEIWTIKVSRVCTEIMYAMAWHILRLQMEESSKYGW